MVWTLGTFLFYLIYLFCCENAATCLNHRVGWYKLLQIGRKVKLVLYLVESEYMNMVPEMG